MLNTASCSQVGAAITTETIAASKKAMPGTKYRASNLARNFWKRIALFLT